MEDFKDEFARRAVAFDTETDLIQQGLLAPPLVCGSWAWEVVKKLTNPTMTVSLFQKFLDGEAILVGANIAYDMAVMAAYADYLLPAIFAKYERDEVYDIQIAEALNAIAGGHLGQDPRTNGPIIDPSTGKRSSRYSLASCVDMVLGRKDAKENDYWRLRYAMLREIPMERWPLEAKQYPIDDAVNTLEVALAQVGIGREKTHRNLHEMGPQARAAFALHLACAWGPRVNPASVEKLEREALESKAKNTSRWVKAGFLDEEGGKEGRYVKERLARAHGAVKQCAACGGTGKIDVKPSGKGGVYCTDKNLATRGRPGPGCDGTGLNLADAPTLARTDKGGIQAGRDFLSDSGDDELMEFASYQEDDKLLNVYIPFLKKGIDGPLNLRANVLVASGRVSYDDVIQQIPRSGGVRECFEPRPGFYYCSTDYSSGELCTLAQVTLWAVGRSKMAEIINESKDPGALHSAYGAKLAGVEPAELMRRIEAGDKQAKGIRQSAKAFNFGLPGGMGEVKLVLSKRKKSEGPEKGYTIAPDGRKYIGLRFCILVGGAERCGVDMIREWKRKDCPPVCKACVQVAAQLKAEWLAFFDEMPAYFNWVSRNVEANGELKQFVSDRVRGGLSFCDGANTMFQGLLADGAKRALWKISKECYVTPSSPLHGSRVIAFFHDEVFSEVPVDIASDAGNRQAALMVEGLKEVVPDVYVECLPALMRRWSKDAKTVYAADKSLTVWEGK